MKILEQLTLDCVAIERQLPLEYNNPIEWELSDLRLLFYNARCRTVTLCSTGAVRTTLKKKKISKINFNKLNRTDDAVSDKIFNLKIIIKKIPKQ